MAHLIDLFTLKQEMMEMAQLAVLAFAKEAAPVSDELTTRQAYDKFGRRWVDRQIQQGNIKGHRKGLAVNSPIIYSRLELMALKQAEERLLTINLKTR